MGEIVAKDSSEQVEKVKTTLHLPPQLVRKLKDWKSSPGRTTADAIISAYIGYEVPVAEQFAPTGENERRKRYGLPPLSTASPATPAAASDEGNRVVGLFINSFALEDLDKAAQAIGLSRSRYAKELLTAFLSTEVSA